MSLYDYKMSLEIAAQGLSFCAVIMAAMRQADSDNLEKLKTAFPDTYEELKARYNAPGGFLTEKERAAFVLVSGAVPDPVQAEHDLVDGTGPLFPDVTLTLQIADKGDCPYLIGRVKRAMVNAGLRDAVAGFAKEAEGRAYAELVTVVQKYVTVKE